MHSLLRLYLIDFSNLQILKSSSDQNPSQLSCPKMESINTLKGYDKVSDHENQIPSPLPKPPPSGKTLITIISLLLSLLLILAVVASTAVAFFTLLPSHKNPTVSSSNSLKTVCAVTRYPKTCFDALSSSSSSSLDPESILELSLQAAVKKVSNLSVLFRSINDMPEEAAVGDCVKLYADAVSQLNESMAEIGRERKKGGGWLTERVVGDVKTWISAAMSDGETCKDGIEEMGTVVGDEIKKEMVTVSEMMSISLAIVSEMKKLLMVFH